MNASVKVRTRLRPEGGDALLPRGFGILCSTMKDDQDVLRNVAVHEDRLSLFIQPARRARFRESLRTDKLRSKLGEKLAHFRWLDERYIKEVPTLDADVIAQRLRILGAPDTCVVVSEEEALDGREMLLDEALRAVLSGDCSTLLSCTAGRLAFYCDEARSDVAILVRPAPT